MRHLLVVQVVALVAVFVGIALLSIPVALIVCGGIVILACERQEQHDAINDRGDV